HFLSCYLIQTAEVPQQIPLTVVEVGGNVTLKCPLSDIEGKFFHWYKHAPGYMVQTVASGSYSKLKISEQFNNSRFSVTEGKSQYLLTIRNVTKEDEATYFCQNGTAYSQSFNIGIFLAVKDQKTQQKRIYVKQSPETASVQLGASMTLQCSLLYTDKESRAQCPGEHSLHWFRAGSGGFHPSIIYTHSNRSDEQEERSCVYSLSKTIQNSSDAGTYYCAVVTCGEILFGEGTKVETIPELDPVNIVLGGLLAYCLTVIAVLIFFMSRGKVCEHCQGRLIECTHIFIDAKINYYILVDGDADATNYVALAFSKRRGKREKKNIELLQECVYSAVKTEYHTLFRGGFAA
uniref:Ig-like domain-containing protein n=1 Tax=Seriola lalandi dorsalis TaxID=1841481 RepID=A0A3B4WQZ9_SERLL